MRIFVGNLNYRTDNNGLREAFERFGQVTEANVVLDRETQRSRGFGFVEMPNAQEAEAAIRALNGQDVEGRNLTVNESQPKPQTRRW